MLIVDAGGHVGHARRRRDLAQLGRQDMRRRRGAERPHPLPLKAQPGGLLLGASNRNPELSFWIDAERRTFSSARSCSISISLISSA